MSIYADRKHGKLTGRFRVEVQRGDQRKRGSAKSFEEAQRVEQQLIAALEGSREAATATRQSPSYVSQTFKRVTLGEAAERAKQTLWQGQDTEAASLRKLTRVVDIVGASTAMDDIDTNTLDMLAEELQDSGCSNATVNRYFSNVSKFLKFCLKRDLRTTPLPELDWKREDNHRIRWITYSEEAQLMELLPEPFRTVVYVAIRTGMRAMELLTIKPDQLTERWVHLWETKNDDARSVPLNRDLYQRLLPIVSEGLMPDYWELRYQWDQVREKMGLADDSLFVFHACRHTYATRAIQAGVNIRVLQKLMGHKTIQTTLRYAHVDDGTLAEAAISALDFHDNRLQGAASVTPEVRGNSGGIAGEFASPAQRGASNKPISPEKARWRSGYAEDCKS